MMRWRQRGAQFVEQAIYVVDKTNLNKYYPKK